MRAVSISDTPASRAMLFQLMLESTLVVLSPNTPGGSKTWTSHEGDRIQLVTLSDDDGTVLPVFTSAAAILHVRPEGAGYVALAGSALFEMAANAGVAKIVFDPGSRTNGFITRSEIEALGRGRLPVGGGSEVVAAETAIRIGRPAVPPATEVLDAVRSALRDSPNVGRAWLTMIQQGENQPEVMVAIRFVMANDEGSMRRIIEGVSARCGAQAAEIRFLRVDESLELTLDGGAGEVLYSAET